jgi:DUF4097 and DUF4098 domain-containing protein YvlB
MERNRRFATWAGAALGIVLALLLNVALANGSDDDTWCNQGSSDSPKYRKCGFDQEKALVTEEFHHTYPLAANGRVQLENINGPVHISGWDRNEIKVDAVKGAQNEDQLKDAEIRIDSGADSISIETKYREREKDYRYFDGRNNPASVEYTLTVPRNANLDEIKLINGHLDVTGVTGEVRASCVNGRLTARGLAGEVKLATVNGHLDANFDRLQATPIELSSVNGPVDLTLPSDAKASIKATTVHGGIDNDFGLHTNNHRFMGHDLYGELGGGGVQIRLQNVNGRIDVHHANDGHALSPARDIGNHGGDDEI